MAAKETKKKVDMARTLVINLTNLAAQLERGVSFLFSLCCNSYLRYLNCMYFAPVQAL